MKQSRLDCLDCFLEQDHGPGFRDILDATVVSIPVNAEIVEVTHMFSYLGSAIHSSTSCELGVN